MKTPELTSEEYSVCQCEPQGSALRPDNPQRKSSSVVQVRLIFESLATATISLFQSENGLNLRS